MALRLPPDADVRQFLTQLTQQENITAGIILSAVGSLSAVQLRFAGQDQPTALAGKHEILTLGGTLGTAGVHLHMSVADAEGNCRGGHVALGCRVFTTLELAIALLPKIYFDRVPDPATGFLELLVTPSAPS